MSHVTGDYNNNMTAASCNYRTLDNYTNGYSMNVAPRGKVTAGAYITPSWSPIGYEDLSGKVPTCSGYPSIDNAYSKARGGSCQTTYRTSFCNGLGGNSQNPGKNIPGNL